MSLHAQIFKYFGTEGVRVPYKFRTNMIDVAAFRNNRCAVNLLVGEVFLFLPVLLLLPYMHQHLLPRPF